MHHGTLLDGEMVVDENFDTGSKCLRYLVYDIMALNAAPVTGLPFLQRYPLLVAWSA